jgi:hypothetical protein
MVAGLARRKVVIRLCSRYGPGQVLVVDFREIRLR